MDEINANIINKFGYNENKILVFYNKHKILVFYNKHKTDALIFILLCLKKPYNNIILNQRCHKLVFLSYFDNNTLYQFCF